MPSPDLTNEILKAKNVINHVFKPKEQPFCHYTTLQASQSILASREFRLSNLASLNDPAEWQFGLNVLFEVIQFVLRENSDFDRQLVSAKHLSCLCTNSNIDPFEWFYNLYNQAHIFFAMSFSHGKNFALWRLYGDDCKGAAIEVDAKKLSHYMEDIQSYFKRTAAYPCMPLFQFSRILYFDPTDAYKSNIADFNALKEMVQALFRLFFEAPEDKRTELEKYLLIFFVSMAALIKDIAYACEEESRLLIVCYLDVLKYQEFITIVNNRAKEKVYFKVPQFPKEMISKIKLGPCLRVCTDALPFEELVLKNDWQLEIEPTCMPYQNNLVAYREALEWHYKKKYGNKENG